MFYRIFSKNVILFFCFLILASCREAPRKPEIVEAKSKFTVIDVNSSKPLADKRTESMVRERMEASQVLIDEAQRSLNHHDVKAGLEKLRLAKNIAPYDYRPYLLMAKMYFILDQNDLAYQILEQAGQYNIDNDIIFEELEKDLVFEEDPFKDQKIFIAPFKDNKRCAFSFMFDDGPRTAYETALPIFDEFGFKATIPINPGIIDQPNSDYATAGWPELVDANRRGFEIANHSLTHRDLTGLSKNDLEDEVNKSFAVIKEKIKEAPVSFIFPFDKVNADSLEVVSKRHFALRQHQALLRFYPNIYLPIYGGTSFSVATGQRIIDMAIKKRLFVAAECHAVKTNELTSFKPLTAEFLREHLAYLKQKQEQVWVDTFKNVCSYLKERKETQLFVEDQKDGQIIFRLRTLLDPETFSYPLTVVVNVDGKKIKNAQAFAASSRELLPLKIVRDQILVDVGPNSGAVMVRWQ